jgi:hypothetical protein
MQKQTTIYYSRVDAIIAVAKRLNLYEKQYQLSSENFFDHFSKGLLADTIDFVEWSNDYRHFLALKFELEDRLSHAA